MLKDLVKAMDLIFDGSIRTSNPSFHIEWNVDFLKKENWKINQLYKKILQSNCDHVSFIEEQCEFGRNTSGDCMILSQVHRVLWPEDEIFEVRSSKPNPLH